jgi:signal peptidase I
MNYEIKEKDNKLEDDSYYGVGSFLWEVVKVFFWALLIIMPIRMFLFQPFFVQGASMEPNFQDGNYLIINELGYKQTSLDLGSVHFFSTGVFKELQRGDVVVFRYPKNPSQFFIKRVIGLPGEHIKIENGKIIIFNKQKPEGFSLDEKQYLAEGVSTNNPVDETLTEDEYFVLGDNRNQSHDSRAWGPLNKSFVIGRVLVRAWPLSEVKVY